MTLLGQATGGGWDLRSVRLGACLEAAWAPSPICANRPLYGEQHTHHTLFLLYLLLLCFPPPTPHRIVDSVIRVSVFIPSSSGAHCNSPIPLRYLLLCVSTPTFVPPPLSLETSAASRPVCNSLTLYPYAYRSFYPSPFNCPSSAGIRQPQGSCAALHSLWLHRASLQGHAPFWLCKQGYHVLLALRFTLAFLRIEITPSSMC